MTGQVLTYRKQFGDLINVDATIIKESLDQAQKSLVVNVRLARVAQELKESNPELRLYVMSNISQVSRFVDSVASVPN